MAFENRGKNMKNQGSAKKSQSSTNWEIGTAQKKKSRGRSSYARPKGLAIDTSDDMGFDQPG